MCERERNGQEIAATAKVRRTQRITIVMARRGAHGGLVARLT